MKPKPSISSPAKRLSHKNYSVLRHAIKNLDMLRVRDLISSGNVHLVNIKTKHIIQLFSHAVEQNDIELASMILDKMPKLKSLCLTKELLWKVLANDSLLMVEFLIRAGANVNITNSEGLTLLQVLVSSKDCKRHKLAILAIQHDADVNAPDTHRRSSVLHEAIKSECPNIIQGLIGYGADVNIKNSKNQTALYVATLSSAAVNILPAFIGGNSVAKYLRERRAADALCFLTKMGAAKIPAMEAILHIGTNVDHPNVAGVTALSCAVQSQKMQKVCLLLKSGADPNKRDGFGDKPLWKAAGLTSTEICILLTMSGADVNGRNRNLQCSLHSACRHDREKNIRLLLRLGASMNVTNRNGYTPFSMMKNPAQTAAGQLVIKHFAYLTVIGEDINEMDLLAIYFDSEALKIYEASMIELAKMSVTEVCNGIMYDCFYTKSTKELSMMARDEEFVKEFYRSEKLFPLIFAEMKFEMKTVMKRRKILLDKEKMLNEIFGDILPYTFLKSLENYLCHDDLILFDLESKYLIGLN